MAVRRMARNRSARDHKRPSSSLLAGRDAGHQGVSLSATMRAFYETVLVDLKDQSGCVIEQD
jgi:hypothetical protein